MGKNSDRQRDRAGHTLAAHNIAGQWTAGVRMTGPIIRTGKRTGKTIPILLLNVLETNDTCVCCYVATNISRCRPRWNVELQQYCSSTQPVVIWFAFGRLQL